MIRLALKGQKRLLNTRSALYVRSMCARIIVESNVCSMPHPHGQHASEATYIKELGLPCRNTIEKRINPKEMLTFVME